jgi:hypothetical protein
MVCLASNSDHAPPSYPMALSLPALSTLRNDYTGNASSFGYTADARVYGGASSQPIARDSLPFGAMHRNTQRIWCEWISSTRDSFSCNQPRNAKCAMNRSHVYVCGQSCRKQMIVRRCICLGMASPREFPAAMMQVIARDLATLGELEPASAVVANVHHISTISIEPGYVN